MVNRRISKDELPTAPVASAVQEEPQTSVEQLLKRIVSLEKGNAALTKSYGLAKSEVSSLKEDVRELKQYRQEHDKLHQNATKSFDRTTKDLVQLVRNVTAQADLTQTALKAMLEKKSVPVVLETKAPNVTVKAPDIKRDKRGPVDIKFKFENRRITGATVTEH